TTAGGRTRGGPPRGGRGGRCRSEGRWGPRRRGGRRGPARGPEPFREGRAVERRPAPGGEGAQRREGRQRRRLLPQHEVGEGRERDPEVERRRQAIGPQGPRPAGAGAHRGGGARPERGPLER